MINERAEFAAYTEKISYTARNRNDRTWLGRFTFDMLREFEGMARVLTILARGYMWAEEEPDPDRAYRALCAWCSAPTRKNDGDDTKSWREKSSFPEYHTEFPELVDGKGCGWLYRHVKSLRRFAKEHPELVDAYAAKNCELLGKDFNRNLRRKLIHYQVPLFSPSTDQAWSLSFDCVIADAQELGPLRGEELPLTSEERERLARYKPAGMPLEMLETLIVYYKANRPEDSDWVVMPVTNFDACFGGSGFSRKYLSKIPKKLMQREKQSYGVSRYKVDLKLLSE